MIRLPDAHAENGRFAVDGYSPGANPLFDFATRANTGTGQDFLKSLTYFAMLRTSAASAATASWLATLARPRLTYGLLTFNIAGLLFF
jgi:hypothetical protein